jgi:hypothetical protein
MISKNCYVPVLELVKLNVAKQIEKIVYISSCINNESSVGGCRTFLDVYIVGIGQAEGVLFRILGKMLSYDSSNKLLFKRYSVHFNQTLKLGLVWIY